MGLSAGMWTSVSGLLMHGEKMGVVGNNIANISTIGYKGQRMDFEDFLYQNSFSASGPTQIGRGVGIGTVMGDFSQGGTETTNSSTDMLIDGAGFFQVKDQFSDQVFYTRAGNFNIHSDGVVRNPAKQALQGWIIPDGADATINISGKAAEEPEISAMKGIGNPTDIRFNNTTLAPKQTTRAEMTVQLNSKTGNDNSVDPRNPMFSLFNVWDGSQPADPIGSSPLAAGAFLYSSSMKTYDEGGAERTLTTYYDQIENIVGLPPGYTAFEYIVTMDPKDDMRTYGGKYDVASGTAIDDMDTYTDPTSMSATKAGLTGGSPSTFAANTTGTIQVALDALNRELDRLSGFTSTPQTPGSKASVLTLDEIGVEKYPSGGWHLDASDPNVAYVLANQPAGAASTDFNTLTGMSTPNPARFDLDATGLPGTPPDPADANLVKKMADSDSAGVLMMGTMIFDGAGLLLTQSAYTYKGSTRYDENALPSADPNNLSSWEPAPVSNNGFPVFTPNFSGHPLANSAHQNAADTNPYPKDAASYLIEYSVGLKSNEIDNPWKATGNASTVGNRYNSAAIMKSADRTANTSTAYGASSYSNPPVQDGYSFGSLTNHYVDANGVFYGVYSNNQQKPLYQVAVYDFMNEQGLRREGGNNYSATSDSGQPSVGPAGTNGLGTIRGYSIEQSNVDLSIQFVQMISTQRGYQANSKAITTTDSMLETVINIVR